MRKTSHDGADSSSITSGKDSDTKKSATTFSKMKKSSIKRKVQNFSHESDDGIIEPLLQTDKEKIEIANRSAKYLLNKSKTESIHEKDNKFTEGYVDKCSVSTPVSSTSNIIPASTSYICSSAPIHNHMNTNIFSAFEASTGSITTKNQILVEIDNSKPGRYSPSPLIFTTAKIHTDSKTKVMEPVQVTPVPILSTIEGTFKAGAINNPETSCSVTKTSESIKALSVELETNLLPTYKDKSLTPTIVRSPTTTSTAEISANLFHKDIKLGHISNSVNLPTTKLASNENKSLKQQPILEGLPTINTNIPISDKSKQPLENPKCATSSKGTLEKQTSPDKSKTSFSILCNIDNTFSIDTLKLQNQENTHKINVGSLEHRKTPFVSKDSDLDIKPSVINNIKIQRQKNESNEAITDSLNKIVKTDAQSLKKDADNNFSAKIENLSNLENKNNDVRITPPITTKASNTSTSSAAHLPKTITTSSLTEFKTAPTAVSVSTSKVKSITPTINLKPTLISANKSQSGIKSGKDSSTTSSKLSSATPSSNIKITPTSVTGKLDASTSSSSQAIKTDVSKPPSKSLATTLVSVTKDSKDSLTTSSKLSSATPSSNIKVTTTSVTGKPDASTSYSSSQAIKTDVSKPPSKSLAATSVSVTKDSKDSLSTSSKLSSATPSSNIKETTTSVSGKPDIVSTSSNNLQSIKTDSSLKSTVTTVSKTLPSYIVSTSKTKIGSTLTSTAPAVTSKAQAQKSLVNVNVTSTVATTIANPSTSTANGTKHTNFSKQTKSKVGTIKKDGRA